MENIYYLSQEKSFKELNKSLDVVLCCLRFLHNINIICILVLPVETIIFISQSRVNWYRWLSWSQRSFDTSTRSGDTSEAIQWVYLADAFEKLLINTLTSDDKIIYNSIEWVRLVTKLLQCISKMLIFILNHYLKMPHLNIASHNLFSGVDNLPMELEYLSISRSYPRGSMDIFAYFLKQCKLFNKIIIQDLSLIQ